MSKAVQVSDANYSRVKMYAEEKGIEMTDAADKLLDTAFSRLAALSKYGASKRVGEPRKRVAKAPGEKERKPRAKKVATEGERKKKATKKAAPKGERKKKVAKKTTSVAKPAEA